MTDDQNKTNDSISYYGNQEHVVIHGKEFMLKNGDIINVIKNHKGEITYFVNGVAIED